ncbi:MAG TPA: glycosyltransferase [Chloroflexota bacterium]
MLGGADHTHARLLNLDVSVVVPTYNRRASLGRLLRALEEQTYPRDRFEVLVIDDGSDDGTPDYLRSLKTGYSLRILNQPHQGPAEARNLGVASAAAELILFLDDDVVPAVDLIQVHVATHAAEGDGAVVIGPMSPPRDWPRSPWVRWEEEKLQSQYDAMLAGLWSATERQFYTANSSVGRQMFLASGGFDASFKRAEDVELGYRLRNMGARFVFNPAADVLHYAARTFSAWRRTPYQYGRYDVIMSREKGHEALVRALREFNGRHPLNRALSRAVTGRPWLVSGIVRVLCVAVHAGARVGAQRTTSRALSGMFNLLYWQGVCDELGGRKLLWRSVAAGRIS